MYSVFLPSQRRLGQEASAAGCGTAESTVRKEGSIHATGQEMNDAMEAWLKHMSPEDRAVIDELMGRDDTESPLRSKSSCSTRCSGTSSSG